jgi:hypothetical protein
MDDDQMLTSIFDYYDFKPIDFIYAVVKSTHDDNYELFKSNIRTFASTHNQLPQVATKDIVRFVHRSP